MAGASAGSASTTTMARAPASDISARASRSRTCPNPRPPCLRSRAARPYKRPAEIILLDVLPTDPTGKILKQQLSRRAARRPPAEASGQPRARVKEEPTAMDNPRNASVAVIGAGDFIGAAIARRFAAGGYAVFAGRRNGEKLAPAGRRDRGGRRPLRRPHARRAQGGSGRRVPGRGRARRAARGLRLQRRRQRQLPHPRHHRARLPQGVGDGLLRGLPRGARGGAADAAARPRLDLLHRRHRQPARRPGLRRLRQREVRAAGGRAEHGARARPEEHPRRPPGDRRRRGHGLGAREAARAPRRGALRAATSW